MQRYDTMNITRFQQFGNGNGFHHLKTGKEEIYA